MNDLSPQARELRRKAGVAAANAEVSLVNYVLDLLFENQTIRDLIRDKIENDYEEACKAVMEDWKDQEEANCRSMI